MARAFTNLDASLRHGWLPLCRSSEVGPDPTSHALLGARWVAWRPTPDTLRVFRDRCPHRGAPLSLGTREGDGVRCGYHGWRFDASGACREIPALGNSASIPSRARLVAPGAVHESHGMVFVAIADPITEPPRIAAAEDPSFDVGDLPVVRVRAGAALLADNFLDVAHFPFVHAGTFGANEAREVPQYRVERTAYGFTAAYEHEFANREDPLVDTGEHALVQRRRLTYRYSAPLHLELAIEYLDAGGTNVIGFFLAPEDEETVRIYSSLWRDDLGGLPERMREAIEFEMAVIDEDLRIQSRYEELSIPLDVTSEIHTRADKTTLEMRRILIDFVTKADAMEDDERTRAI